MTSMLGPLWRATQVAADAVAVSCGAHSLTYAQTWDRCCRLAGGPVSYTHLTLPTNREV